MLPNRVDSENSMSNHVMFRFHCNIKYKILCDAQESLRNPGTFAQNENCTKRSPPTLKVKINRETPLRVRLGVFFLFSDKFIFPCLKHCRLNPCTICAHLNNSTDCCMVMFTEKESEMYYEKVTPLAGKVTRFGIRT